MRDDNNSLELFLPDEDSGKLRRVRKPSCYPEKVWGVLLRSFEVLWCKMENGLKRGAAGLLSKRTLILILILCTILGVISLGYILSVCGQHSPTVVYFNTGESATTGPLNLTVMNLMELKKLKSFCRGTENCLDEAIREFLMEPDMVQENTKMVLHCNRTRKVFSSGKGETCIEVNCTGGRMVYEVKEANSKVLRARLGHKRLPLNLSNISMVLRKLAFHNCSEELQRCLIKTLEEFPKEPLVVRDNAKLKVLCGENHVTFISGAGQNEITVKEGVDGEVQFQVKGPWWVQLVRFFTRGRVH